MLPHDRIAEVLAREAHLKRLYTAAIDRLKRERPRIREEEFFAAREGAEFVDQMIATFTDALALHDDDKHESAIRRMCDDLDPGGA